MWPGKTGTARSQSHYMLQAFLRVSAHSVYVVSPPWPLQGSQISYMVPQKEPVLRERSRRNCAAFYESDLEVT